MSQKINGTAIWTSWTWNPSISLMLQAFFCRSCGLVLPQVQICMEHGRITHFAESVCSDLMTLSWCNAVVDFNKAWPWKDLRQSWWLWPSLLSSIWKSYNSRSTNHYQLLLSMTKACYNKQYLSYVFGRSEDWSWFLMKALYLDPMSLRDRTELPIVEQDNMICQASIPSKSTITVNWRCEDFLKVYI